MEPADLRKRHEFAAADRLHRPSAGRILVERQVTSGAMIIVQVGCQDPPKMTFVKDDDMVETFAPVRTDDALDVRRLPGRTRCGQYFRDPHASQALPRRLPIDAVAIADHRARRRILWKVRRRLQRLPTLYMATRTNLSANITETPAPLVITVGRGR